MEAIEFLGKPLDEGIRYFGSSASLYSDDMTPGEDVYLEVQSRGVCFIADDKGTIWCVQLFGAGKDDSYAAYSGNLYGGVKLSDSRQTVRTKLGEPDDTAPGKMEAGDSAECEYPWDIFDTSKYNIHCEYSADASGILLMTVQASNRSVM